ncbi:MAG: hypothetical protein ACM3WU_00485 [Bacillota bacterium]
MRRRLAAASAFILVLACLSGSCTAGKLDLPPKTDFSNTAVLVWDLSEPRIEGAPDYPALVRELVAEFEQLHDVKVEVRTVSRREVEDLLTGKSAEEKPDLVCTGEWPFVPEGAGSLSPYVSSDSYIDIAARYWEAEDGLRAIPAYVHWTGMGYREGGTGVSYMWDSPAFMAALACSTRPLRDADRVMEILKAVLSEWGEARPDPLASYLNGSAKCLFPLTPSMFRRLSSKETGISMGPIDGTSGSPFYFYTVPAYIVLADDPATRACAAELGKRLAANLGRWAARALSCMPALREDISVFNLESGFDYERRAHLIESFSVLGLTAPSLTEYSEWVALDEALREVIGDYLRGDLEDEEALLGIRETLTRHTKP